MTMFFTIVGVGAVAWQITRALVRLDGGRA